jgi:hypothetical protein
MSSALAELSTFWVIAANVVWFGAKVFLRGRGCRVSWFWNHFADIGNLRTMARAADDPRDRLLARAWLASLGISLAMALLLVISSIAASELR